MFTKYIELDKCHALLIKLLANLVNNPSKIAKENLAHAKKRCHMYEFNILHWLH